MSSYLSTTGEYIDSDGDLIPDIREDYIFRTSPLHIDTDGDGYGDNEEITFYNPEELVDPLVPLELGYFEHTKKYWSN